MVSLSKTGFSYNPFSWVGFFLETIGRFTYQSLFSLITFLLKLVLQLFKLFSRLCQSIGKFILKLIQVFTSTYKSTYSHLTTKQLKLQLPKLHLSTPEWQMPFKQLKTLASFTRKILDKFKFPTLTSLTRPPLVGPKLSFIATIFFSFLFALIFTFYWFILKDLPKATDLTNRQPTLSTKIYDRNNNLLFTFYKDQNRTLMELADIPDHFRLATLAIEDSQFYTHSGISYKGIFRSLKQIVFNQELQGGSTITQQLIKNALLTPERTFTRKLKELILSFQVELLYSKDEILEMYLNEVSYGGTSYGAEQAAQTYFAKSIKDVNLAEAALLAGLPASPTTYSPFGTNPYLSIYRQHQVLNRMIEEQYIAPQEAQLAKQQKIALAPQTQNIKAPHFVMFVKDQLVKTYGETLVEQGGLEVTTSLDLNIQNQAQEILTKEVNQLFPLNITNGGALITKPKTGEILAMVGSRDYFDTDRDGQVNLTLALRQPGSAIKPINYSIALDSGFTPASILQDTPVIYDIPGSRPYAPINYDSKFHGSVTLRQALANSYNVPAVKLLASYGVDKMINQAKKLGITTWNQPERYGLSLTLGGAEVKMVDMAVVFGSFANQGLKINLHPILKIKNSQGKTLMDFSCDNIPQISLPQLLPEANGPLTQAYTTQHLSCQPDPVLNPNIAYLLSDILSDPYARAQAFGLHTYLNIPEHQVAVKTGTTNDKRDNWTIGYTTDFLTAVWVGNNDNSPMSQVASGVTGASPIWHKLMVLALKDQPVHTFKIPSNLIKVNICTLTGQLACNGCPSKEEYFIPGTEPQQHCSSNQIKAIQEKKSEEDKNHDQILTGASTQ